ncbi:MAG: adenylate cyclase, partial [Nannocystaceae bacterium]
ARLCSVARPGEIIISQWTMAKAKPHIIVEARNPVMVKGKQDALQVYAVVGVRETAPPSLPT